MSDADEYDSELALFESEIQALAQADQAKISKGPDAAPSLLPSQLPDYISINEVQDEKSFTIQAAPVLHVEKAAKVPEWQRRLLERDFEMSRARQEEEKKKQLDANSMHSQAIGTAPTSKNFFGSTIKYSASCRPVSTTATTTVTNQAFVGAGTSAILLPHDDLNKREKQAAQDDEPSNKKQKVIRTSAGEVWRDDTLNEWPEDDHRIFVGDLGGDANDELLRTAFVKYESFIMAKIVRDKRTNKCKGYGFVSFGKPEDMVRALKEMNGKYLGNRPVKLRKSTWKSRMMTEDKKQDMQILRKYQKNFK